MGKRAFVFSHRTRARPGHCRWSFRGNRRETIVSPWNGCSASCFSISGPIFGAHYQWRAEYGLARVAERAGRREEAIAHARTAVALVEEMGLGETAETSDTFWFLRGLEDESGAL